MSRTSILLTSMWPFLVSGCGPAPSGLAPTPAGNGPRVVFDLEARPLPDIPFPNDVAARVDPTSPTGLRLNLSTIAPSLLEADIRKRADSLDGFGTFAPVTVRFDAGLDVEALHDRQAANRDFGDDAVFIIDVTPGSPTYGKPVMLDFDRGFFPLTLRYPNQYMPHDPRGSGSNLVFETETEKEGQDTDGDQVLDRPNTLKDGGDAWDDLMTFYERETDTLILQPVVPLRERTTYAVVVTRRVLGAAGTGAACQAGADCAETGRCDPVAKRCREPVRSPFAGVNDATQTEALAPLKAILPAGPFGLSVSDISFAWTFTTQSITGTMKAIREGLYGHGPLARLAGEFPAVYAPMALKTPEKAAETGSASVIMTAEVLQVAQPILQLLDGVIPSLSGKSVDALIASYDHVDFIVAGTFKSPNFLVDRDGIATETYPADDDESFDVDPVTGKATYGSATIPFVCAIPKERPDQGITRPFPVSIFMHGTASNKLMGLGYAGQLARMGLATCAIDGFAHGLPFPSIAEPGSLITEQSVKEMIATFAPGYEPIYDFMKGNRVRDLNMDGNLDPAGDYWTYDPFHTRDAVRQTVVDLLGLVRILRSFDGKARTAPDKDGKTSVMGDFDGDGKLDIGGPDARYFAWGISLGGIVTGVFTGVEPALDAAVLVVGGGGLTHVAMRSAQAGVPQMAILPILGPVLAFDQDKDKGDWVVRFAMPNSAKVDMLEMTRLAKVDPGSRVVLTNLTTGAVRSVRTPEKGGFSMEVQGDALRATEIRGLLGFDPTAKAGGEPCAEKACAAPLKCLQGACGCEADADCPAGQGCDKTTQRCGFRPQPVDSVLATAKHPALGDLLKIEVFGHDGTLASEVHQFGADLPVNGIVYPKGAPLVNLYRGFGYIRQTPDLRKLVGVAQTVLDPADPVNWARHYRLEPLDYSKSDPSAIRGANVLVLPSIGDPSVPTATGINIARAAGIVGYEKPDGRYGDLTQMEVLVQKFVVEGIANTQRYKLPVKDKDGKTVEYSVMYDIDDLDGSRFSKGCGNCEWVYDSGGYKDVWRCTDQSGAVCGDGFDAPFDLPEPLRATVIADPATGTTSGAEGSCVEKASDKSCRLWRDQRGLQAMRLTMTEPWGYHGLLLMAPQKAFDIETYIYNMIGRYFMTRGTEIIDDVCLEDSTCGWMPE